MSERPLHICLVAGEHSGDQMAADLMRAIIARTDGNVRFSGLGGEKMQEVGRDFGFEPLFSMHELAIMGLVEIVPHIPRILRRIREIDAFVRETKPDVVITIDSPSFSFRLGRALKGSGVAHIHYVAPTVWAWRPRRAKVISHFLKHLFLIFPFEAPYFEKWGLGCTFVGHPVMERGLDKGNGPKFRERLGIRPAAPLLCVLPGSRRSEVGRLLPIFGESVARLHQELPELRVVIPTVSSVSSIVRKSVAEWPVDAVVVEDFDDKRDAFAAADLALAASGTVTYELAAAGLPMVVAYRVTRLTGLILKVMVKVRYATVINLILGRQVVPEYLQEKCTAGNLSAALHELLTDPAALERQRKDLSDVADKLGRGRPPSSQQAAEVVLRLARDQAGAGPR